jgi:two-component system sensor histidine kinase PilS (NtrC family)
VAIETLNGQVRPERAQSGWWEPEPDPAPHDTLLDRIKWTTLARVVMLTAVLAFVVAMDLSMADAPVAQVPETTPYKLTTAFYFGSFFMLLVTHLLRAKPRWLRLCAVGSVLIDVALAASLVAVTDGLDSLFLFGFPLAVLNGAVLLERFGAVVAATLSAGAVAVFCGIEVGAIPWSLTPLRAAWLRAFAPPAPLPPFEAWLQTLVQVAAVYGTALLSSHLVTELARARQRDLQAKHELARLRVRYQDLVHNLPDGLLTVSPAGIVTGINPAGLQILELPQELVVGSALRVPLPDLPESGPSDHAGGRGGGIQTYELERARPNSATQILACRRVAFSDLYGPVGELIVLRDMSETRQREEVHRMRERLAAIGAMAAAVAHEIRNPLASISGAAQMLEGSTELPPTDARLMAIIQRETGKLSAWIGEFLDFARPRPVRPTACDLRQVASDAVDTVRRDARVVDGGVRVDTGRGFDGGGQLGMVADSALVGQVVWNLLVNAVQAVEASDQRVVAIDMHGDAGWLTLTVDDSGPGIDAADLPHIFEPFWTTKGCGTGLGLATVDRHVTAHGGEVQVERSASLGGARFVVRLPRKPPSDAFAFAPATRASRTDVKLG